MVDFIHKTLDDAGPYAVVLFSKSDCPCCATAKNDLHSIGIVPVVVELDERQDGDEIEASLEELTGQTTVPSTWVCGRFIGDSDDLYDQINVGLFDFLLELNAERDAENAGMKPCGSQDAGAPCLQYIPPHPSPHN